MQRKIIHIDMDCFYAAIEMRDNPELFKVPLGVGGGTQRGVLCTANYLARQYGVRSAMSTQYAKRLCPELVVLKPDFNKYKQVSYAIRQIFKNYTDLVEPLSLDEAYLDVTCCSKQQGIATYIAKEIRNKIFQQERITASAGIAPNKFLAKVASDWHKPNGQLVISPTRVSAFVFHLPVEKVFGVGKVTAQKLHAQGYYTCGDLQRCSLEELIDVYGRFGERLYHLCRGVDDRPVENTRERQSLSVECTFSNDINSASSCLHYLKNLYKELQQRLQKHQGLLIHKQFIKIKFNNFQQTTVEMTAQQPVLSDFEALFQKGLARYKKPVRLLGVGVGFKPAGSIGVTSPKQLTLPDF